MFVEAISLFKIRLVVETHSEYLIRKLQYLVAKGDAKPESAVIYYFNKPDDQNVRSGMTERVVKITINEDGHLSDDFGPGFIDEANNISISLFGLNKRNRN
jgi:predicted ATPase